MKKKNHSYICNSVGTTRKNKNIKLGEFINHLPVKITNKRNGFTELKKEGIIKANQLANIAHRIVARCCNRLLTGKKAF